MGWRLSMVVGVCATVAAASLGGCLDDRKQGVAGTVDDAVADSVAADMDTTAPADSMSQADTVSSDVQVPQGCCLGDGDCAGGGVCFDPVATVGGLASDFGVCVAPDPREGWCWRDADCGAGEVCHGAAACACGLDCDPHFSGSYEGPGVCVDPSARCQAVTPSWAAEVCDAANLVVWDGERCVATCLGCCDCGPFCDLTFESMEVCEAHCGPAVECPSYVAALAESDYAWTQPEDAPCPALSPMNARCTSDADCEAWVTPGLPSGGTSCVLGSCVWCHDDAGCEADEVCRAGRCVLPPNAPSCPDTGGCSEAGCRSFTQSEVPCPACTCDSPYNIACEADDDCLVFSSHPYRRCVYGRCVDCKDDADCGGGTCSQPGLCYGTTPDASALFGTWLLGWSGGMDHFSYFRFEPDGTLRRGAYEATGGWSDDIPAMPCWAAGGASSPLLGTWEPEVTASGLLVVRLRLNTSCDGGDGWVARYLVSVVGDGPWRDFAAIDDDMGLMGWRADPLACAPDLSTCEAPLWP